MEAQREAAEGTVLNLTLIQNWYADFRDGGN
jgi:hypothetical protein